MASETKSTPPRKRGRPHSDERRYPECPFSVGTKRYTWYFRLRDSGITHQETLKTIAGGFMCPIGSEYYWGTTRSRARMMTVSRAVGLRGVGETVRTCEPAEKTVDNNSQRIKTVYNLRTGAVKKEIFSIKTVVEFMKQHPEYLK